MDGNAHVEAFLARLRAEVPESLDVHDGEAPNLEATPYLVVYPEPGVASSGPAGSQKLSGVSSHFDQMILVHAVGGTRWESGWAADRARDVLLDVVLTVDGRSCWPIRQEVAQGAREDVQHPSLWLAIAGYRLKSD